MMVANDRCNLGIVINLGKDPLANCGVHLHLTSLIECQRTSFFQQSCGEPYLADVVNEAADMGQTLLFLGQSHPCGNIAGVDRDSCRMTGGVLISRIEGCNQSAGEG